MRVLVDPEAFRHRRCGMTRYYAGVCEGLRSSGVEVDLPVVLARSELAPKPFDPNSLVPASLRERIFSLGSRISRWRYHARLAAGDFDVILPTSAHHDTSFLRHANGKPFLLVCHDTMRSLPIPGGAIDAWAEPLHKLLYLVRRAARVVCVSDTTRNDLLHSAEVDPEKVVVVRTANLLSPRVRSNFAETEVGQQPYLLFVGSRQVRKNFDGALRALAPLLRQGNVRLLCTGRLSVWEEDLLDALELGGTVRGLDLTDDELVTTYEGAIALVYPTFYEGFGLPVLEAMAVGCPVIASNTSSLPEIAGEAALLVDPTDRDALLQAVTRVVSDKELRARLSRDGRARAAEFSFDRMMSAFIEQLRAAASTETV